MSASERDPERESLRMTAEAEERFDTCPECGDEFLDIDTRMTGTLVFIHSETPLETCSYTEAADG